MQRGAVNQVDSIPGGQVQTNVTLPTPVASLNQAFVTWSKTPDPDHVTWDDNDPILGELINTTTLQFRATAPADATHTIWWQVIEFTNPADIFVQKGTIGPTAMNQGAHHPDRHGDTPDCSRCQQNLRACRIPDIGRQRRRRRCADVACAIDRADYHHD